MFFIVFMFHHYNFTEASYICDSVDEGGTASITCSSGVITTIDFASYGTPTGYCGQYYNSTCNAETSINIVYNACINRASCSVYADNYVFGDPCVFTFKRLFIQVTCTAQNTAQNQPSIYPLQSTATISPTLIPTSLSPTLIPTSTSSTFSPTTKSPTLSPTSTSPTQSPIAPIFWSTKAGLTIVIVLAVVVVVIVLAILLLCYCVLVRRPDHSPTYAAYATVYVDDPDYIPNFSYR